MQESATGYSLSYTYDALGNRLTSLENGSTTTYAYNNLNQLTQSQGTLQKLIPVQGTVSGTSPLAVKVNAIPATVTGNQFTANNIPINSGLNTITAEVTDNIGSIATHQITVTYNPTTPAITYTYDKNGNLIQQTQGTQITQYSYDFENRLKTYLSPTQNASYTYNGQGKRISKTVNGTTTRYYYDGDELIAEKTGTSFIYYLHGPKIDELLSDSRGYYYHTDGLGSVVSLTDTAGTKTADYTYKAFGQLRSQTSQAANPWLFTGRQLDAESGLYFYRNRYYDARAGRFITRDPIGFKGGVNLYGYCSNNPINLSDAYGLYVALGERHIFGPGNHTVIIIHPGNPSDFGNDPRFYRNTSGELEATLSANPDLKANLNSPLGNLTATPNALADRPSNLHDITRVFSSTTTSDAQFINNIFASAAKYNNNLPYDPTPWLLDPFYNSNSYASGILKDANSNFPDLPWWQPGADKPIPLSQKK